MGWSAGELFDVPRAGQRGGLVWLLKGERVDAWARIMPASLMGGTESEGKNETD